MAKRSTKKFLPNIFQTNTNEKFLNATVDQLIQEPSLKPIYGYVGQKDLSNNFRVNDSYITESDSYSQFYQLEPGLRVRNKQNNSDLIVDGNVYNYVDMLNQCGNDGSVINDHARLFGQEYYNYNSFTELDKLVNYRQYYWVPSGPAAVEVNANVTDDAVSDYHISRKTSPQQTQTGYVFAEVENVNPVLYLVRGRIYNFHVDQPGYKFWIQTEPGLSGHTQYQHNIDSRQILGVVNNGTDNGVISFGVPLRDAQDRLYNMPISTVTVDVITDLPYNELQGNLFANFLKNKDLDGTRLNTTGSRNIIINNTAGWPAHIPLEQQLGVWQVSVDTNNIIQLVYVSDLDRNRRVFVTEGNTYGHIWVYRDLLDTLQKFPTLTALMDKLYYQDSSNPDFVGEIRLLDPDPNSVLNISDILGSTEYTSPNGIRFSNGLKVTFGGNVNPPEYNGQVYVVENLSHGCRLMPWKEFVTPELFNYYLGGEYDFDPYDTSGYDSSQNNPVIPDYITISRGSRDRNAWSRNNRWFHRSILDYVASITGKQLVLNPNFQAQRPIVEFVPDIQLFDHGQKFLTTVNIYDQTTTDAFNQVLGLNNLSLQSEFFFHQTILDAAVGTNVLTLGDISGVAVNQLITGVNIHTDTRVTKVDVQNKQITLSKELTGDVLAAEQVYFGQYNCDGILLVDGIKIIFATDTRPEIRKTIYQVKNVLAQSFRNSNFQALSFIPADTRVLQLGNVSTIRVGDLVTGPGLVPGCTVVVIDHDRNQIYLSNSVTTDVPAGTSYTFTNEASQITLTPVGTATEGDVVVVDSGIENQGVVYHYHQGEWQRSQQKLGIPQPPLFEIVDKQTDSFGHNQKYLGTNFKGSRLFGYADATGTSDKVLGIPLKYQNIGNIGDIVFTNYYHTDVFNYTQDSKNTQRHIRTGYAASIDPDSRIKYLTGWDRVRERSRQKVVYSVDVNIVRVNDFIFKTTYEESGRLIDAKIRVNARLMDKNSYDIIVQDKYVTLHLHQDLSVGDRLTVMIAGIAGDTYATYEIPVNLGVNNKNELITDVTLGQMRNHLIEISSNSMEFSGEASGINNSRDIDLTGVPGKLLQHSAGMWAHTTLSLNPDCNIISAIRQNMTAYGQFMINLHDQINNTNFADTSNIRQCLDLVLATLSQDAKPTDPYYHTDMAAHGLPDYSNQYPVINLGYRSYNLNQNYDLQESNYTSILAYRNNILLLRGKDYTVQGYTLTLSNDLAIFLNDTITILEYASTQANVIPATPSKLGLYPLSMPVIETDNTYTTPIQVIIGHDGSITPAYGDYRDNILMEYERRVYNNCQTFYRDDENTGINSMKPGAFRKTDYTMTEWNKFIGQSLLEWSGQFAIDIFENTGTGYDAFTINYNSGRDVIYSEQVPGHWRGIYQYFYDTDQPHHKPWQMLGFADMPDWWTAAYGSAPYTNANMTMWMDLEMGFIRGSNPGQARLDVRYSRPGLSQIIPVDSHGNLLSPDSFLVKNYQDFSTTNDWKVGDWAPAENSWRRSSYYPFAIQIACALARPAEYASLRFNTRDQIRDVLTGQLVDKQTNTREWNHKLSDSTDFHAGTNVWVRDFILSRNQQLQHTWYDFVENSQINLVYKLAGYTDKQQLILLADQVSPQTTNNSIMIPNENYHVVFSKSSVIARAIYSAVTIVRIGDTYKIYGFDTVKPYFLLTPVLDTNNSYTLTVGTDSILIYEKFSTNVISMPYGQILANKQAVVNFLMGYGHYLAQQGFQFDDILDDQQTVSNWTLAVKEFLFWNQQHWGQDVVISVTPAGVSLKFHSDYGAVETLSNRSDYTRLVDSDGRTLKSSDYRIYRDGNDFHIQTRSQNKGIHLLDLSVVQYEHALVLDNRTVFNDVIFDPVMGNRQSRIKIQGNKTQDWNGSLYAPGYLINVRPVENWQSYTDYYRGDVTFHKNHYYTAKNFTPGAGKFNHGLWYEISGDLLQHQLIPNPAYDASQFLGFYDVDKQNVNALADMYGRHATGFSKRRYLNALGLDVVSQHKFYLGMLKQKGSQAVVQAFIRAQNESLDTSIEIQELFAVRLDRFGNTQQQQLFELDLAGISSINNQYALAFQDATDQDLPGANNYRQTDLIQCPYEYDKNIFAGVAKPQILGDTGPVRSSEVSATVFNIQKIDQIDSINSLLGEGSLVWVANDNAGQWATYRVTLTDRIYVTNCSQTAPNELTFTTDIAHGFQVLDVIMLHSTVLNNTNNQVDLAGFYTIKAVAGAYFTVNVKNNISIGTQTIRSLVYKLVNVRFTDKFSFGDFQPARGWKNGDIVYIDHDPKDYSVLQNTDSWQFDKMISPIYTHPVDRYGERVVINSRQNYSVVNSPGRGSTGAVYLYTLDTSNNWNQTSRLNPANAAISDFGKEISISDQDRVCISGTCAGRGIVHVAEIVDREISIKQIIYYAFTDGDMAGMTVSKDGNWLYVTDSVNGQLYSFRYTTVISGSVSYTGDSTSQEYAFPSAAQTKLLQANDVTVMIDQVVQIPNLDYTLSPNPDNIFFTVAPDLDSVITIHYRDYYKLVGAYEGTNSSDWGSSISTDATGRRIAVGHKSYGGYGTVEILEREVRIVKATASQTKFHIDVLGQNNTNTISTGEPYYMDPVITVDQQIRTDYMLGRQSLVIQRIIEIDGQAVLTVLDHGMADQDQVQISGPVPANFVNNTAYYVQYVDKDTLKLCTDRDISNVVLYTDPNPYNFNSCNISYQIVVLSQPVDAGAQISVEYSRLISTANVLPALVNDSLEFGQEVKLDQTGAELVVGAPGYRYTNNRNGAIFRYLDTHLKYNQVTSNVVLPVIPANSCLYINDHLLRFATGSTQDILDTINNAGILGISAALVSSKIQIIAAPPAIMRLRNGLTDVLSLLGMSSWNHSQLILSPLTQDTEKFGERITLSPDGQLLLVGTSVSDNYKITTFDNGALTFDNRTLVDLKDKTYRSGTAYLYELQGPGDTDRPDKYVYASTLSHKDLSTQSKFGTGVAISENWLAIGSPSGNVNDQPQGTLYIYKNPVAERVWKTLRRKGAEYDSSRITHAYLYDRNTRTKMQDLIVLDPLHSKFAPTVASKLNYISNTDPAVYTNAPNRLTFNTDQRSSWGYQQVGQTWWDTNNIKLMDQDQGDIIFKLNTWNNAFPNSSISIYQWIESDVPPLEFSTANGKTKPLYVQTDVYSTRTIVDNITGAAQVRYYFWVRNSNLNDVSTIEMEQILASPRQQDQAYISVLDTNLLGLYNCQGLIGSDTSLILRTSESDTSVTHSEWAVFDDGSDLGTNQEIYDKIRHSLSGQDDQDRPVPDTRLPEKQRYGTSVRPRQTVFGDLYQARQSYFLQLNEFCKNVCITLIRPSFLAALGRHDPVPDSSHYVTSVQDLTELGYLDQRLYTLGAKVLVSQDSDVSGGWSIRELRKDPQNKFYWYLVRVQTYDVRKYWTSTDWYSPEYTQDTKTNYNIDNEGEINNLPLALGDVIYIRNSDAGGWKMCLVTGNGLTLLAQQGATVSFSDNLWDNSQNGLGLDGSSLDSTSYGKDCNKEVSVIFQAVIEHLMTQEFRTDLKSIMRSLMNLQLSQTLDADWVMKTSLVDMYQRVRKLDQLPVFLPDIQNSISEFFQEIKPFHVYLKKYVARYDNMQNPDVAQLDITDFDLQPYYNIDASRYRSPQLNNQIDQVALARTVYAPWLNNHAYGAERVRMIHTGTGYIASTVSVKIYGNGTGAKAKATVVNGVITKITVTDPGKGYTQASVTITGINDTPAVAAVHLGLGLARNIKTQLKFDRYTYSNQVQDWKPDTSYKLDQVVSYIDPAFRCVVDHVSNNRFNMLNFRLMIIRIWTPDTSYNKEDVVIYRDSLWDHTGPVAYVVTESFVSGNDFDAAKLRPYAGNWLDNAADRIWSYYQTGPGKAGRDLSQLMAGIKHAGVQVIGPGFDQASGYDQPAYDQAPYDPVYRDELGLDIIRGPQAIDTIYTSQFTDQMLGIRPEDIITEGGQFVDANNVPAPEELLPGRLMDTLDITVTTSATDMLTHYINPEIRQVAYVSDGIQQVYSWSDVSLPQAGSEFVWVAVEKYGPLDLDLDYTLDLSGKNVILTNPAVAGLTLQINIWGSTGFAQSSNARYISDGVTRTFLLPDVSLVDCKQVYVRIQQDHYTDFTLSKTDNGVLVTLAHKPKLNDEISLHSYGYDNGLRSYARINEYTYSTSAGAPVNYNLVLADPVLQEEPAIVHTIVRVNNTYLTPSSQAYYTANGMTSKFSLSQLRYVSNLNLIRDSDIVVVVDGITMKNRIEYQVVRVAGQWPQIQFNVTPLPGSQIIISDSSYSDYRIHSTNSVTIDPSLGLHDTDRVHVLTLTNHDMIDLKTWVYTGNNMGTYVNVNAGFDGDILDDSPFDNELSQIRTDLPFVLPVDIEDPGAVMITINGMLQMPYLDYRLIGKNRIIFDQYIADADIIVVRAFGSANRNRWSKFRIFKDLTDTTTYQVIKQDHMTYLTQDLYQADEWIYVADLSRLADSDPSVNKPGVVFVNGERITYGVKDLANSRLGLLRRGTAGTGAADRHDTFSILQDASDMMNIPQSTETELLTEGIDATWLGLTLGSFAAVNVVAGTSMLAPRTEITGSIRIDGQDISIGYLTTNITANRSKITNAINAVSSITGVTAIDSGSDTTGIKLSDLIGQDIVVDISGGFTDSNGADLGYTGLQQGTSPLSAITVVPGSAMTAPSASTSTQILINGTIVNLLLTTNTATNRSRIVTSINALTAFTGVIAADTGNDATGITLTGTPGFSIFTQLIDVVITNKAGQLVTVANGQKLRQGHLWIKPGQTLHESDSIQARYIRSA